MAKDEVTIPSASREPAAIPCTLTYAPDTTPGGRALLPATAAGRYEVGAEVARGGMGAVLEAEDRCLRRRVAMKVMLDRAATAEESAQRFVSEARITGQLEHPGVVPVYDLATDSQGRVFYAMKMVRGTTLDAILARIHDGDPGALVKYPLSALLTIFLKICDAVAFAHSRGVVHRDLKPENIMVGEFGEVLVLDWGLAKVLGGAERGAASPEEKGKGRRTSSIRGQAPNEVLSPGDRRRQTSGRQEADARLAVTMEGTVMGTPAYMAPEQARGEIGAIDARTDIYALGAILYAILTLDPPVEGRTAREVLAKVIRGHVTPPATRNPTRRQRSRPVGDRGNPAAVPGLADAASAPATFPHCPGGRIPEPLSLVVMKSLALDPAERYQTVPGLQAEIEAWRDGFATVAEGAGLWRQLALLIRRHRVVTAAALAVVLALTAGLAVALVLWRRAAASEREARAAQIEEARQRRAADVARDAERQQREAAQEAQVRAERENYANTVALAAARIGDGMVDEAREMLDGTPVGLRHWEFGRLRGLCHPYICTMRPEARAVRSLAFSPDGRWLAIGTEAGQVQLWDYRTGTRHPTFGFRGQPVWDLCFTPDGAQLVVGCHESILRVVDIASGTELRGMPVAGLLNDMALSPDGRQAATAGSNGAVVLCDLREHKSSATIAVLKSYPHSIAFHPGGELLATASADGVARIWEVGTGNLAGEFRGDGERMFSLAFSPDGRLLAAGDDGGVVRVWDLQAKVKKWEGRYHRDAVSRMAYSPDGNLLATASRDGHLRLWSAQSGEEKVTLRGHGGVLYDVAFTPDGRFVATGSVDGTVRLWPVEPLPTAAVLKGHAGQVRLALYSPDGTHLVTGGDDGTIRIWDARSGRPLQVLRGHGGPVTCGAFSPDGAVLAIGGAGGPIDVWATATWTGPRVLGGHAGPVDVLRFGADASTLWSVGRERSRLDASVRRWLLDAADSVGEIVIRSEEGQGRWGDVAPLRNQAAFSGEFGGTRVYDLESATLVRVLDGYGPFFAPGGASIGTHTPIGIDVLDCETWSLRQRLAGHTGWIYADSFTSDGRRYATAGGDGAIRIWDWQGGKELLRLWTDPSRASSVTFSPGGKSLVTGHRNGDVCLWDAFDWTRPAAEQEDALENRLRGTLASAAESPRQGVPASR